MGKFQKFRVFAIYFASFLYFLTLGLISFLILESEIDLSTIMKIIAVHILLILISAKFILSQGKAETKSLVYLAGLLPVILFIFFLIFATGGLSSPFLILTHFFAIGIAFLLSPQVSISFIAATVILVTTNLIIDKSAQAFLFQAPFAATLYFVAYIALVPFSYAISREYKIKEEWVKILEKQIATSKNQEEELLKNITDSVIALDQQFNLVYLNQSAMQLTKYGQEILGQSFFKFFSLKNKEGKLLEPYSLPFEETLSSKMQSVVEDIQISSKEKKFTLVDIKILPVIGPEGPLGLILIIRDQPAREEARKKGDSTASIALSKFLLFLSQQKQSFLDLEKNTPAGTQVQKLLGQNEELTHLAEDFIYTLKLEFGDVGSLVSLVDLGEIAQEVIAERKNHFQALGISLIVKNWQANESLIQPKTGLKIPVKKRVFSACYVLGNIAWIQDSLKRILELASLLCQKNQRVEIAITQEESLAKITISCQSNRIPADLASELFERFYGKLGEIPELTGTSGLEGFIAKNLIERMGANISAQVSKNSLLTFTITFGVKENQPA